DRLELLFAERLGVLLAAPGLGLPARRAVVGGGAGHAAEGELLAHHAGALVLLDELGLEAAAAVEGAGAAQGLHGLDALHAADRLDVAGDDLVGGLRRERQGAEQKGGKGQQSSTHRVSSES